MDLKLKRQLDEAEEHFRSWKLIETYNILRRFYDRLPFQSTQEHADYIGMFCRTLMELGKESEMGFYIREIERQYEKCSTPHLGFQLAVLYIFTQPESSKSVLESIIRDPSAKKYHPKSKMLLAKYYESKKDFDSIETIIATISDNPDDPSFQTMLCVWRAIIFRERKEFRKAHESLDQAFSLTSLNLDWYSFVSCKITLAELLLAEDKRDVALKIILEVEKLKENRPSRAVQKQFEDLSRILREEASGQEIIMKTTDVGGFLSFLEKEILLKTDNLADRLLLSFTQKSFIEKKEIISMVYQRDYNPKVDDQLIYSQIHAIRRKLKSLGLPGSVLVSDGSGYRLIPKIRRERCTP